MQKKEVVSQILYEDKEIMAFLDIEPFSNGHTLIIPKQHFLLDDLPDDVMLKIINLSKKIVKKLQQVYKYDGIVIMTNSDKLMDIHHFHLHVYGMNKDKKNREDYDKLPLDQVKKQIVFT